MRFLALFSAAVLLGFAGLASADSALDGLKSGNPELKSAGALTFGPEGVLFVADPKGAALFAIDTQDRPKERSADSTIRVEGVDGKIAALLGTTAKAMTINDVVVNPLSGNAYASVSRGAGPDAKPVLVRIDSKGSVEEIELKNVKFAKFGLEDLNTRNAQEAITDLAYHDGRVFLAGLSNEEFSSRFRAIPFPFASAGKGTSVEIFHGAHGKLETRSPVRTFTTFKVQGQDCLLAAYTCTPLVKFPLADLKPGAHVKGVTIAELGNRNKPLDMIAYSKDGKEYLLIANSARGVMKVKTDGIADAKGIEKRVPNTEGLPYETVASMRGVEQLDKVDEGRALILVRDTDGALNLETVTLP